MHRWLSDGRSPVQIHKRLAGAREKAGQDAPNVATIRRALKGMTHNRSRVETRGRKKKLTTHNLQTLGRVRVQLIEKADGEAEVDATADGDGEGRCHGAEANLEVASLDALERRARGSPIEDELAGCRRTSTSFSACKKGNAGSALAGFGGTDASGAAGSTKSAIFFTCF